MPGYKGMVTDWDRAVRMLPSARQVARLAATHGYVTCCKRWSWINPRTIGTLIAEGKAELKAVIEPEAA